MRHYSDFITSFDDFMRQSLASNIELIEHIGEYTNGGKRIRSKLCYLTGQILGCNDFHVLTRISAVIELIHTATLMHDDVIDQSSMRRGHKTVHQYWGVPAAILTGDFLYSRAFQLVAGLQNHELSKLIADASNLLAEGEVSQLVHLHQADTDESTYFDIIYKKTGVLFAASLESAAVLARSNQRTRQATRLLGRNTGLAFQIIDDLLDYIGDSAITGKDKGTDFREGKMTLPLITALRLVDDEQAQAIRSSLGSAETIDFSKACDLIQQSGAYDYCRTYANNILNEAIDSFVALTQASSYRDELISLVEESTNRTF